jgi:hypothetical protein
MRFGSVNHHLGKVRYKMTQETPGSEMLGSSPYEQGPMGDPFMSVIR